MGTVVKAQTQTIAITGTDVRIVAEYCWEEIIPTTLTLDTFSTKIESVIFASV